MFVHFLVVLYLNKDIMCNKKYFFFPSYLTRLCEINWLIDWLIDWLIAHFLRPEESISFIWRRHYCRLKAAIFGPFSRRFWPLSSFLSCHICCDMVPFYLRSHPKDYINVDAFYEQQGVLRTYADPDPRWNPCCDVSPVPKNCLLQNHWTNFSQTLHKVFLGEGSCDNVAVSDF